MKPLVLAPEARDVIERASVAALPREACGALLARAGADPRAVVRAVELTNLARAADTFAIDPGAVVALDAEARAHGLVITGFWHSHPAGPARPSERDLAAAWDGHVGLVAVPRVQRACEFAAYAKVRGASVPLDVAHQAG